MQFKGPTVVTQCPSDEGFELILHQPQINGSHFTSNPKIDANKFSFTEANNSPVRKNKPKLSNNSIVYKSFHQMVK